MKSTHAILYIIFNIWAGYINTKYNVVLDNELSVLALSSVYLFGIVWIVLAEASSQKGDDKSMLFCAAMSLTDMVLFVVTVVFAV